MKTFNRRQNCLHHFSKQNVVAYSSRMVRICECWFLAVECSSDFHNSKGFVQVLSYGLSALTFLLFKLNTLPKMFESAEAMVK